MLVPLASFAAFAVLRRRHHSACYRKLFKGERSGDS